MDPMDHDYCAKAVSNILQTIQLRQEQHKKNRPVERPKIELNAPRGQRRRKKPIRFDDEQPQSMSPDLVPPGRCNKRKYNKASRRVAQGFDRENVNFTQIAASSFMTHTKLSASWVPNVADLPPTPPPSLSPSLPMQSPSKIRRNNNEPVNKQNERYYRHLIALSFMISLACNF